MKVAIIGGDFGIKRESSVVSKLASEFTDSIVLNGGSIDELPTDINSDLIIWMPNIINEEPKNYPHKAVGNVLICSKVMREGYTKIDAVSRIFKMQGNAVIAIYKKDKFYFELFDALGNSWYNGSSITMLANTINQFYNFTKAAVRVRTAKGVGVIPTLNSDNITRFIQLNNTLANNIQTECGERFFGNISTRCQKLFPTMRNDGILVSPRNSNKQRLTVSDMVYCYEDSDTIYYLSDSNKPSVDSPIQMKVYDSCPQINYMIHGHAFIKDATMTSEYYLCGDLRESNEVISIIGSSPVGCINLKNHGFLLYADSLDNLENLINTLSFYYNS